MPIFIKTELIKKEYLNNKVLRKKILYEHKLWVKRLLETGINIKSGFLVDEYKKPGSGGFLIVEMKTFKDALEIIKDDPMIKNNIVEWKLNEWIDITQ